MEVILERYSTNISLYEIFTTQKMALCSLTMEVNKTNFCLHALINIQCWHEHIYLNYSTLLA